MARNQDRTAAPRVRAAEGGVPDDQWRRLHPISPVINAWKALAVLAAIIFYQNIDIVVDVVDSDFARDLGIIVVVLLAFGALVLFLVAAVVYSWLAWRAARFAVVGSGVYYRSGIFMRTLKHARLDRIQAVDVSHPLLGRIFGLGRLNIEVAGGADSNLSFGYLKTAELEALRAEILARAAGVVPAASGSTGHEARSNPDSGGSEPSEGPLGHSDESSAPAPSALSPAPAPVAPERVLYTVPIARLIGSLVLNMGMVIGIVFALAGAVGLGVALYMLGPAGLTALAPAALGALAGISVLWSRFAGEFNFTAAVSPDGIRTRAGLLETRSQTVPPRRVHAVRVVQPWLWRRMGWYRVTITQAGYAGTSDSSGSRSSSAEVLLPVGTRQDAELALWLVIRDLGVDDPVSFIEAALRGEGADQGFIPIPASAGIFDPLARRRRAFALTGTSLVIRDGWLTHSTSVIPVERLQSASVTQGPWERRRGLVDVHAEIVPGSTPAVVRHADGVAAAELVGELRERARVRRASEPPEKWMTRVVAALDAREGARE
ncbi:PH domain-containing protein [Schaalia hyovaginalis]|uniref:PH domain-containing protein n=1 Tax=Schaalia hyovaginalis TaxID=29316 RepID=UPI0026F32E05|nr:PH domain-containing protein [Schaalia hyovaginalis]MDD7554062.1 PH domain-containing protein [Schaalia hyovaginalis]MDY3093928.1 PH domain-containing protein [Schaalia hyovaginalis]MDY4492626.1 PH domain-containing protein [Schaalia hyovaginalis]